MSIKEHLSRRPLLGLVIGAGVSALLLAACGGGAGSAPPTKSYAFGPIQGFGSVVVNGVHYKEDNAIVVDEDGQTHNQNDLKLGMVVEIHADEVGESNNVRSATAQNITFDSLLRGPVESVGTGSLVVLGQTVEVNSTTVFDEAIAGGLSAVKAGLVVRVYGTLDPTKGVYRATRIEPQGGAELFSLRGAVTAYDPATKTLRIGSAVIDVSGVTSLPDGLKAGSLVRVKLQTSKVSGSWVAISVKSGLFHPQENDHTEMEGVITDFTSSSAFSVDGTPVDASKAAFPDGSTGIVKGARVEVEGAIVNGVLVATAVKLKTDQSDEQIGFGVEGAITAIDVTKSTFVLRGVTVSYAGVVSFVGGTAANLKIGSVVEVRGSLSSDHVTLNAVRIEIKH